jgi:predicted O-methyltransferase YrrM
LKFSHNIKLYRKLRFRKGYGVHSPFTFNLITKVIEERAPFYVFDEIENFRNGLFKNKNTDTKHKIEAQHRNYGALLFRLVNWFKCRNVLQIRSFSGIMSLYLASARNNCTCFALEENVGLTESAERFAELQGLTNLHFFKGDYAENLAKLKKEISAFDLIFINHAGDAEKTAETISLTRTFCNEKTMLVIDGISCNKNMQALWQSLKNDSETRVTIDLYALGLVFFDKKLNKQNYKTYFDYGKKQNLHSKGRRRFHFFGWRRKNAKKQHKD